MRLCYSITLLMAMWPVPCLQARSSLLKQAIYSFENNNIDQARELVAQAIAKEPSSGKAWYYQGAVYEHLLRKQIATKNAPQLLEKTLAAYRKALALTQAPSQYHSFAQVNLNNLWFYYLDRGRRYYLQENFARAIDHWQCCEQIQPKPGLVLYQAVAAHQNAQYLLAKKHYISYLKQAEHVPALVFRALAQLNIEHDKNLEEGLKAIVAGLQKHPFSHDLLHDQLIVCQQHKQLNDVKQQLDQKIAEHPNNASCFYQLGYWYEYQGAFSEALEQYQKAARLAPQQMAPLRQQGLIAYQQAAKLTQSMKEMPDEVFQEKEAKLKEELNNKLRQALTLLKQVVQHQPQDIAVLETLKTLYEYLEQPLKAAQVEQQLRKYQ